ncbi:MAG TPA: FAD-binding oxidoreductase [Thermomicrobiales bacterium]|nr:FAD-binding oxidoreductase [Thermomicrobiales bacterium]
MPSLEVDTIVIGGGLLGWSAAYPLVKAGQRVALVDRADEGHATQAGAGIIAPGMNVRDSEAGYELRKAAIAYYSKLVDALTADGEPDTGYEQVGALFIARSEAEAETLPALAQDMVRRREDGLGNVGEVTLLDSAGARALFPPLGEIYGAVHASDACRVNGRTMRDAIRSVCQRNGCELIIGEAELLSATDDLVEIRAGSTLIEGRNLIIAAGAWSCYLAEKLGFDLPIFPQRGQILHLDMPDAYTGDWPIIVGYYDQYILTFRPNRVVCGATRESDSGYEVRLTAAGVKSVLDEGLAVAPGLGNATIAEIRIGLRPFSPDKLPVLGRAPGYDNIFLCTGHGPSGLQLGPFSGRLVAGLVLGESPSIDIAPFSAERFQG